MHKIAVVGCGNWGKNLVRNYANLGALASVCDENTDLAQQMASTYKIPALSFDAILSSEVAGVVIAAPAAQHYALGKAALLANKHVFVEKPLCLNLHEAEELCQLATTNNKTLMVGHLLHYHTGFLALQALVNTGRLGKLQYIYSNRLNLGKFRTEENILWSFAPHDISMILSLAGESPASVLATGAAYLNPSIYDVTNTQLTFENGIHAHIFVSWLHPFKEQKLVVVGDRGMAVFDDGLAWADKLKLYPHQINWVDGRPTPQKSDFEAIALEPTEPLRAECQHFLNCLATQHTPRTDGPEGLQVLRVLTAAQQSLQQQTTVPLTTSAADTGYFAHASACVDAGANIGAGTKIWHYTHVFKDTHIGANCTLGQNVMVGPHVTVGQGCKIQNNVSLFSGVTLADNVFCGPACVFTNVHNPRAAVSRKQEFRPTFVDTGATIGANATILCGHKLGAYCLIGAGSVVTKDVKPHAVMAGNPAQQIGWVSHAGEKLGPDLICPREQRRYVINQDGQLEEKQAHVATAAIPA